MTLRAYVSFLNVNLWKKYRKGHMQTDVFNKPSAWKGLETKYKKYLPDGFDPRIIVEIGVDYGYSFFHFAKDWPLTLVMGIDWYGPSALHSDAEVWVKSHLPEFPNTQLIVGDSRKAAQEWKIPIDLLHIDAIHDYENLRVDFTAWEPHVRPGGVVMFHDVISFPDMACFFWEIPGHKELIQEHHGLGYWFKPMENK